jgi:type II secretory pathway pseudopilin PulG
MELVVALAIMAMVLSFAGVIFRVSIDSQRLAAANAEIMQKLRVITDQLDADFRSLRKDAEIFVVWGARPDPAYLGANPKSSQAYERFDRIMFFTTGDFQAYGSGAERGNAARICYTIARGPSANPAVPNQPAMQKPHARILARTQHILIPPGSASQVLNTSNFTTEQWRAWNSEQEVDRISLAEWKRIPWSQKINMLSVIGDVTVEATVHGVTLTSTTANEARGVLIDPAQPATIHSLFCRGVGQFMVQGWNDEQGRWIPEVNPNEDESLEDSDFLLTSDNEIDPENDPGLWYPRGGSSLKDPNDAVPIDEEHFNEIAGLGRALKFTFTLYDSRNLIKDGRTFTHIVYLDN